MSKRRIAMVVPAALLAVVLFAGAGQALAQSGGGLNPGIDYTKPNWGFSPPLHKFVDSLPGLGYANRNNLGQYIPVATPNTTAYAGCDYYELADNATNETGFYVQRSSNGTTGWTTVGTVPAATAKPPSPVTYTNTGLTRNKAYYYRVQSYNASGGSGYTSVVSAKTLP